MKSKSLSFAVLLCLLVAKTSSQCLTENNDLYEIGHDTNASSIDLSNLTDFNFDLLREIFPYNESRNFFFSPYSIWNALTLAYFGSAGETEHQLKQVLRTTDKISAIKTWRQLQYVYKLRQINNTDYTFNLANKAFFDNSVQLRPCIKHILKDEIENLDFQKATKAAKTINNFVSQVTVNRIKEIVSPEDIINSKMALVNAAFFKSNWLYQFKKSQTKPGIFYTANDELHYVPMMKQESYFKLGASDELGARILEIPYTGNDMSMIILLPPFLKGDSGFTEMVKKLDGPKLHAAMQDLYRDKVEIQIPRFKLKQEIRGELIDSLSKLGITDLFNPALANLTDFSETENLSVGRTVHKAFIEVNEKGSEAAAATSLIQFRVARPMEKLKFECNHPFLFVVMDIKQKNILFIGAYKNPKAM